MALIDDLKKELNPGCVMMMNNPDEQNLLFDHLQPDMRVLEFGSGLSTIAIVEKVKEVVSVEYDHNFFKAFKQNYPANAKVMFVAPNNENYQGDGSFSDFENYVTAPMPDKDFDIVFIDGRARVACAEYAAKYYLKEGGIIFIHDYNHPQGPPYRRMEYEIVESFLKREKQAFAMAMFTVLPGIKADAPPQKEIQLTDQDTLHFHHVVQRVLDDQIREMGGVPWSDQKIKEAEKEKQSEEIAPSEPPAPHPPLPALEQEQSEEIVQNETPPFPALNLPPLTPDTISCWHQGNSVVSEMNRFYEEHIKGHDIAVHMGAFTTLLNATDRQGTDLLDLGCGTAMLSEFCRDFNYYGADLPHIIAGCAMRHYPRYFYHSCNLETDDLSWIKKYSVIATSGVIDIMQHPMQTLIRILEHTKEYLILHRQDISETQPTHVGKGPGYGDFAWHSTINRQELIKVLDEMNFDIVKEEKLQFANWEDGGRSLLIRKRKTWALYEIDHQLYKKYFLGKENGFFVEAGANDGLRQSNTMFFEFYKNWKGILIEPIEEQMDACKKNRSERNIYVIRALVDKDYSGTHIDMFYSPENNGLLSVVDDDNVEKMLQRAKDEEFERRKVSVASFNDIVSALFVRRSLPKVDLMVLDIEGQELNALKGIDFEKHRIEYLLIEELNGGTGIADYLAPWYDKIDLFGEHDVLYKRK